MSLINYHPHQGLAVRGRAAEEEVYGDVTADARNDRAGRHRKPGGSSRSA